MPDLCCWKCQVHCNTLCFLRAKHGSGINGHTREDGLNDEKLCQWVFWGDQILDILCDRFAVLSHEDLLSFIVRKGWYPKDTSQSFHISDNQLLIFQAFERFHDRNVEKFVVQPPSAISLLLHWSVLSSILIHVPSRIRKNIAEIDKEFPKASHPLPTTTVIDSHVHLDKLFLRNHKQSWPYFRHEKASGCLNMESMVCGLNFRETWGMLPKLEGDNIYFSMGLHPHQTSKPVSRKDWDKMEQLLAHPKCIALGEVGLDYGHNKEEERLFQQTFLEKVCKLAKQLGIPIVIHCREGKVASKPKWAQIHCIQILKKILGNDHPIYLHCFSSDINLEEWNKAFSNLYFGMSPMLIKEKNEDLNEVDLRRMLLESDAPYLIDNPWDNWEVLEHVSLLKNLSPWLVALQLCINARRFFRL